MPENLENDILGVKNVKVARLQNEVGTKDFFELRNLDGGNSALIIGF